MVKKEKTHSVVKNLCKIKNDREIGQNELGALVGFDSSTMSKIFKGTRKLSLEDVSKIAAALNMRDIDLYTYPKIFRECENINNDIKAQLTVELREDLKEDVLKLIFGNSNLKVINKIT